MSCMHSTANGKPCASVEGFAVVWSSILVFWGVKLCFQLCGSHVSNEGNGVVPDPGTITGDSNHQNV